ncbi:TonB-dependent receptor [Leptolyngbya sp. 15MV]|nr:TonB-dependent receptor [Leptolyngbya sp. 15MV]
MTRLRYQLSTALVAALACAPQAALAQDAPPPTEERATGVGEIVVTAQRREESLSRVGISVTAVGADEIATRGIDNPEELVKIVPGFQASTTYGGNPVYTLRGVGFNTRNAHSTAPVGIYLDEAAIAYPYMTVGLLHDLERVEVLKGPQGTLYGRNATGGLINYVSAKPTDTPSAGFAVDLGTFETINASAYASGPIGSGVRARIALNSQNRGEYQRSVTRPDVENGDRHLHAARLTLDFGNGGPFSATLIGDYWQRTGDNPAPQAIFYIPDIPGSPLAGFANPRARASIQPNPTNNRDVDFYTGGASYFPGVSFPGLLTDSKFYSAIGKIGIELSPSISIQSLTSYQKLDQRDLSDAGGVQTNTLSIDVTNDIESFSQELRLIGEGERLNWSVGAYYADDTARTTEFAYNTENATIARFRFIGAFVLPHPNYTNAEILQSFGNFRDEALTETQVYALFGNLDYRLSDQFKVTLGGRYTKDKTQFEGCTYDTDGGSLAFINTIYPLFGVTRTLQANQCYTLNRASNDFVQGTVQNEISQSNFAWRANIDYTPSDTALIYASVSRGFKSGGFPVLAASNEAQFDPIRQEKLTAYELGAKLSFADRQAQLNVAGFYYDYTDKQVYGRVLDAIFGTLSRIRNVPKSRLYGIEGELTWRLTQELTFRAAGVYLNSRIQEFTDFTELGVVADIAGQPFTYTPEFQGNVGMRYEVPVSAGMAFFGDVNYAYQTDTQADSAGITQFAIDSYGLLDATVGLKGLDGSWQVQLYGTNLTNEYYWTGVASGTETVFRFPGMPRQFGVRTRFQF